MYWETQGVDWYVDSEAYKHTPLTRVPLVELGDDATYRVARVGSIN